MTTASQLTSVDFQCDRAENLSRPHLFHRAAMPGGTLAVTDQKIYKFSVETGQQHPVPMDQAELASLSDPFDPDCYPFA